MFNENYLIEEVLNDEAKLIKTNDYEDDDKRIDIKPP